MAPDYRSVDHENPQPQPAQNGHTQPVEVSRVLFTEPSRAFWINGRLEANEFGEIDTTGLDEDTIKLLLGQGVGRSVKTE